MVLVVDDDPSLRVVLRLLLEREGHMVVEAPHGKAALIAIQQKGVPDVVTTDLRMPVLGGEELIRHLRSDPATAAIPIVVISGNQDAALALHARRLVEAVLLKPFDVANVARCIKDVAGNAALHQATG
ncbi:MAG TPA: response regulator [Candidatus Dormibacteraeota bacterium]|jgi:CheY-like chemotaxis protein